MKITCRLLAGVAAISIAGMLPVTALAQPMLGGHYGIFIPSSGGSSPTPSFQWITGNAALGGGSSPTTATFAQGSNSVTAGDSLFVVIHGTDASGFTQHISAANCPTTPLFSAVYYAAPTNDTSSSDLICYRKADGTETTSFSTPAFISQFGRGLTMVYIDFAHGSSVSAIGSNTSTTFDTNTITSGQITASAGSVLMTFVDNYYDHTTSVVAPNSGSWTTSFDTDHVSGCTTCGDVHLQATTLGSSGTTAVQNFTAGDNSADFGNVISFAIVP
jgi:hypothetical protein